jgi:hypothetical protein
MPNVRYQQSMDIPALVSLHGPACAAASRASFFLRIFCELQYLMPQNHSITLFRLCRLRVNAFRKFVVWVRFACHPGCHPGGGRGGRDSVLALYLIMICLDTGFGSINSPTVAGMTFRWMNFRKALGLGYDEQRNLMRQNIYLIYYLT